MDESVQRLPQQISSQEEEVLGYCCTDNNGFCIKAFGTLENNCENTSGFVRGILKRAERLGNSPIVTIECESTKYLLQSSQDKSTNVCIVKKISAPANVEQTTEEEQEPEEE